jgi:biotin synthase-like enzyme
MDGPIRIASVAGQARKAFKPKDLVCVNAVLRIDRFECSFCGVSTRRRSFDQYHRPLVEQWKGHPIVLS